jgi:molybdenum cofactor biosynthesis enzyme MoaA
VVTEKCNLNCDGCTNLIPHYSDPENKDVNQLFEDLSIFLDAIDYVAVLKIMGGEPFLNRNLSSLINRICSNHIYAREFGKILFITNGTVVPDNKTVDMLKKYRNKIQVYVSDYGNRSNKIEKKLRENSVVFLKYQNSDWINIGNLKNKNRDITTLKTFNLNCSNSKYCSTILDGKLYLCQFQAHGVNLNLFPNDGNFVDLRESYDLREEIKKLMSLEYIQACNYCDIPLGIVSCKRKEVIKDKKTTVANFNEKD